MANAYIGYAKRDGTIKCVKVCEDGEIENLGMTLMEYFGNYTEVKEIIISSIISINEDEVEYCADLDEQSDDDKEYYLYDSLEDFIEDMNASSFYYLFANNIWYVSKPDESDLQELEQVIEEEC